MKLEFSVELQWKKFVCPLSALSEFIYSVSEEIKREMGAVRGVILDGMNRISDPRESLTDGYDWFDEKVCWVLCLLKGKLC